MNISNSAGAAGLELTDAEAWELAHQIARARLLNYASAHYQAWLALAAEPRSTGRPAPPYPEAELDECWQRTLARAVEEVEQQRDLDLAQRLRAAARERNAQKAWAHSASADSTAGKGEAGASAGR